MKPQQIIPTDTPDKALTTLINEIQPDRIFLLADENTAHHCVPTLNTLLDKGAYLITIAAGDDNKHITALTHVWEELSTHGATRHSLLINIGGGMVTDLGGFAAATYKRGIHYINVPTTLLAMVDAAVGGKTGINLHSLKNEIGAFYPANAVIVSSRFLTTLDSENLASGYAEMLKHGLISNLDHWNKLMQFDLNKPNFDALQELILESIHTKENIVTQDPTEQHIRKALNLGHTLGHAFETLAMRQNTPCLHGYAVAWGLVGELYLSHLREHFPINTLRQAIQYIKENYSAPNFGCQQYEELYELMQHDKKNRGTNIHFTLLANIGDILIDRTATKEEIFEMLDFVREC